MAGTSGGKKHGIALVSFVAVVVIVSQWGAFAHAAGPSRGIAGSTACDDLVYEFIANELDAYDSAGGVPPGLIDFLKEKAKFIDSERYDIRAGEFADRIESNLQGIDATTAKELADVLATKIDAYEGTSGCSVTAEEIAQALEELKEALESETTDVRAETVCDVIQNGSGDTTTTDTTTTDTTTMTETVTTITVTTTTTNNTTTLFDYGDAPDGARGKSYPSLDASGGAQHVNASKAWLGSEKSVEPDSRQVNEDTRDDGLAGRAPLAFEVTNRDWPDELYVNVLVDRNRDGDWADEGEWVVRNRGVDAGQGETVLVETDVTVPNDTWLRITLTGRTLTDYEGHGEFVIGETEDYGPDTTGSDDDTETPGTESTTGDTTAATSTGQATDVADETTGDRTSGDSGATVPSGTDIEAPGFGVGVGLVALLAGGLLAARRP